MTEQDEQTAAGLWGEPAEMTVEEARRGGYLQGTKASKYKNKRTTVEGRAFDSQAEARHYQELLLRQRAGEIDGLRCQVRWPLDVNGENVGAYVADFTYRLAGHSEMIVVDVKSPATQANSTYRLKKKLVKAIYGIEIQEVAA